MKIAFVMMINAGLSRCLVLAAAAAVLVGCGTLAAPAPPAGAGKQAAGQRQTPGVAAPWSASGSPAVSAPSGAPPGDGSVPSSAPAADDMRPPTPPGPPPGSPPRSPRPAPGVAPGAYHHWGLDRPLDPPPPPPDVKPPLVPDGEQPPGLPPVIRQVATTDRVVFLTIDDGLEKDPRFIDQVRDLGLPFTQFLTDQAVDGQYDYFGELHRLGGGIGNHTLTHPSLAGQDYGTQVQEICGQQENLRNRLGVQPRLFRPPYGEYDETTLRAAADCGLGPVVLWRAEMETQGLVYRSGGRLQPGDIVLAHFRGPEQLDGHTMTEMITELLREIQAQGFAVARLEDYV
ncbi:polysaccharide deacetylase family protein [Streptomyces himastatinicus]|uniref:polysaccharide deacetylase family protein n=1 Tax=Streptomyces himastatinicus TaxID=998084 RepID=UPI001AD81425|nr:polysaccharide deacetylase family protein [Streptomyces himastatinicus]